MLRHDSYSTALRLGTWVNSLLGFTQGYSYSTALRLGACGDYYPGFHPELFLFKHFVVGALVNQPSC